MKLKRESLSTYEMENIVRIHGKLRRSPGPDVCEVLAELMGSLEQLVASLTAILEVRRARLATILNAIKREQGKIMASFDMDELSTPGNIEKLRVLEELINDYCFLNEGLRRARRIKKPAQPEKTNNGNETLQ
jgi:hypothetical protein